jgi:N-acetyl-anhydromuramyl-L-alanine amidase AmpD
MKSPNFNPDRKDADGSHPITGLVLHITDGSSESAINWFMNPQSGVSAHYVVTENGNVVQMVEEKDSAWHAGRVSGCTWKGFTGKNPNWHTIGVEAASRGQFPPIVQWLAWARLCKDICLRNNIALNDVGIANHREIYQFKTCPGDWFSRYWLLFLIKII